MTGRIGGVFRFDPLLLNKISYLVYTINNNPVCKYSKVLAASYC